MSIQQSVIVKYGFEPNQQGSNKMEFILLILIQGVMQFAMAIKAHDSDPEIASLADQMKQQFMPPTMEVHNCNCSIACKLVNAPEDVGH